VPRVIAIINVRMGSERLPGKTMREIAGRPLLGHLLDRVRGARGLDGIVVATPESQKNDVIETCCRTEHVACFRGSEDDLVTRTLGALESADAEIGVEIYGDGPLIDPAMIEECLQVFLNEGPYDLVGNDMKATYPSGMYTEAFSVQAFRDAGKRTSDPAIREHGTLFLRKHPEIYRVKNIEAQDKLCRPDIHLDVDTEEDFRVIEEILRHFAPRKDFRLEEIIDFLDAHPEIAESNQHVHRRWKQYQHA
jgi:spore coat polysaccharide biosynthesis protein SpsF (cytidylyltransferase family)